MTHNQFSLYTALPRQELFKQLDTNEHGLSSAQAQKKLQTYGPNALAERNITGFTILKNQLVSPFMYVLFLIGGAYLYTKDFTESGIVFIIIIINVGIGFYQEYHSNKSMQLLKNYLLSNITVLRDGKEATVSVQELVPGDIILLYAGDIIPADCRFISDEHISVDESSMTGESIVIQKTSAATVEPITQMHEASNIGFAGTLVTEGKGAAVVFATGRSTTLGSIATLTHQARSKGDLERGTEKLARLIVGFIFFSLIFLLIVNLIVKGGNIDFIELLLFSAALAITAAPEALPMVTTFCLSRGAAELKKNDVIVKRLSAIGDLGSIEIFCTDKTGTLTENSLQVESLYADDPDATLMYAILSSSLAQSPEKRQKGFEQALYNKLTDVHTTELKKYTLIQEQPFTAAKRRCFSVVEKDTIYTFITKGSPECMLDLCSFLTDAKKSELHAWIEAEEHKGNRVLAIATKTIAIPGKDYSIQDNDHSYESIGLISFQDPIKETSAATVKKAKLLGVQIKIISGDSKNVCFAVAKQLGLENNLNHVVLGSEFEESTDEKKEFLVHNRCVFARTTPQQKYEIIKLLQKKHSVGYIGDGINDAPALKLAHVSFAVNDSAPVAQESAEIILLHNNLLSVILGIKEGRRVIINILKYTTITTAPSFGHFYALSLVALFTNCPPMLPLQLLLLNLLTDFPMIALSTDTVSAQELYRPVHYDIKEVTSMIIIFSILVALFDMTIFIVFRSHFPAKLQTTWFIVTAISEIMFIFLHRTKTRFYQAKMPSATLAMLSITTMIIVFTLPFTHFGQHLFMFSPPHREHIPWLILVLVLNFCIAEGVKLVYYRMRRN